MNNNELVLHFRIVDINTLEFATLKDNFTESEDIELSTSIDFGFDEENPLIGLNISFQFIQDEQPFLLLTVQNVFQVEEEAYISLIDENVLTIPRGFASHLAAMSVGTARGILHEKTNNTRFNDFIIPTINVTNLVTEDILFDMRDDL